MKFMKNLIYLFACLILTSCSKDTFQDQIDNSQYNLPIDYNINTLAQNLGPFSSYFVCNKADGTILLEIGSNFEQTGEVKIGAYLWDKFTNQSISSGLLKIGNLSYQANIQNGKIKFNPVGSTPFLFSTNPVWTENIRPSSFTNRNINVELKLDNDVIVSRNVGFPKSMKMSVNGEKSNGNFPNFKVVDRNNFVLRWTTVGNPKGILCMLRSTGQLTDGIFDSSRGGGPSISRFIFLEDDGIEQLPASLFENIPANAFVELEFWRGDVETLVKNSTKINTQITAKDFVPAIIE